MRDCRTPSSRSTHPPLLGMHAYSSAPPSPPSRLGVSMTLGTNIADNPSDKGWTVRNVRTSSIHCPSSSNLASPPPWVFECSSRLLRPCSPLPCSVHAPALGVDAASLSHDHRVLSSSPMSKDAPSRCVSPSSLGLSTPTLVEGSLQDEFQAMWTLRAPGNCSAASDLKPEVKPPRTLALVNIKSASSLASSRTLPNVSSPPPHALSTMSPCPLPTPPLSSPPLSALDNEDVWNVHAPCSLPPLSSASARYKPPNFF
ncbi:uncharacterized protein B0H18DRAFT_1127159 [Fomitopsis serialis]|uniref:uncharacterized protein n=1 Tax=Fomitopsis serialis TaxID=139415 RepID=UPI002008A707|nr:uncharacterized protein B0H18DRAFT_1127159 [Neoantrodia serialis]KAH9912440.1 hypothetical protein B0H18DRAFT_1127159 [Neoantrodia serialis]